MIRCVSDQQKTDGSRSLFLLVFLPAGMYPRLLKLLSQYERRPVFCPDPEEHLFQPQLFSRVEEAEAAGFFRIALSPEGRGDIIPDLRDAFRIRICFLFRHAEPRQSGQGAGFVPGCPSGDVRAVFHEHAPDTEPEERILVPDITAQEYRITKLPG